jgi:excisionase family DNA binding protein
MLTKNEREQVPNNEDGQPNPIVDPLMTVEEVAHYLRLKAETVRSMARRGELAAIKVGRGWRFKKIAIIDFLSSVNRNALHKS